MTPDSSYDRQAQNHQQDRGVVKDRLEEEVSLKADRSALEEMRKDIPAEKQRANDELALFLGLMNQGTEPPSTVRDRFHVMVQKKRAVFREKSEALRQEYRRAEVERREKFTKSLRTERDSFQKKKRDSKEMREFYQEQERKRNNFNTDERDRRQSFESEMRAQSKDFDSYMREKQNEFNEQFRLYSKKYSERPKEKKAVTGEAESEPTL